MIGVIASLKIKDGKQAEFEAMARDLIPQVRANEPGNVQYTLTRKQGSTTEYVFMEQYKSPADIEAHRKAPDFVAAQPVFAACLDGRPDIAMFDVLV